MKISNTILQAIFIGASLGAVSSCSLTDVVTPIDQSEVCNAECTEGNCTHTETTKEEPFNCPACGLG